MRVPLCSRFGHIRAYALIDTADAAFVSQWRWHLHVSGYAARKGGRTRSIFLHRELLGLTPEAEFSGDHINRDRLDNRRVNLRIVTAAQNRQNRGSHVGSSSGYRGVTWDKKGKKWTAGLKIHGKRLHLGYFSDELEAAEVARAARARLMPYAVD